MTVVLLAVDYIYLEVCTNVLHAKGPVRLDHRTECHKQPIIFDQTQRWVLSDLLPLLSHV